MAVHRQSEPIPRAALGFRQGTRQQNPFSRRTPIATGLETRPPVPKKWRRHGYHLLVGRCNSVDMNPVRSLSARAGSIIGFQELNPAFLWLL